MYQLIGPDDKLIIAAADLSEVLATGIERADLADLGVIETALAHHKARLTGRVNGPEWTEDYGQPSISVVDRAG